MTVAATARTTDAPAAAVTTVGPDVSMTGPVAAPGARRTTTGAAVRA